MLRLILASLLAAIALFFWGFAYWAANPMVKKIVRPVFDEIPVVTVLSKALPESGFYMLPGGEPVEAVEVRKARGPIATIQWHREPAPPMAIMLVRGFLAGWLTCALLLFVLREASAGLTRFHQRWVLATVVGLVVAVQSDLGGVIWWYHSPDWAWLDGIYQTLGLSLAGSILAAFTGPRPTVA